MPFGRQAFGPAEAAQFLAEYEGQERAEHMPGDGGIGLVEDRPVIEGCLGGAEQALDLEQIAIPQHGLERGHLRVGPHHGDAVVPGFLGKGADIDLEVLAAGLEVRPS